MSQFIRRKTLFATEKISVSGEISFFPSLDWEGSIHIKVNSNFPRFISCQRSREENEPLNNNNNNYFNNKKDHMNGGGEIIKVENERNWHCGSHKSNIQMFKWILTLHIKGNCIWKFVWSEKEPQHFWMMKVMRTGWNSIKPEIKASTEANTNATAETYRK